MAKKSDRQQCSDDWQDHLAWLEKNKHNAIPIFTKDYEGFEAMADIGRDVEEAFDPDFNPQAEQLPCEHQGIVTVTITYTPEKS